MLTCGLSKSSITLIKHTTKMSFIQQNYKFVLVVTLTINCPTSQH